MVIFYPVRIAVHHIDKVQMGRARDLVIVEVSIMKRIAVIVDIGIINDPVLHRAVMIVIDIGGFRFDLAGDRKVNPRLCRHRFW